jgi:Viral BACON domain
MQQTHFPRRLAGFACGMFAMLALAACGGGGGSDPAPGAGNNGGGGVSTSGSGAFTLAATSASFQSLRNVAPPAQTSIGMTITGSAVAAVGAAFVGQTQPLWLDVNMAGTFPNLTLVLGIRDTALAAGTYTSTVTVGTADSNSKVLSTHEVQVTYRVVEPMAVSATPLNTSFVFGASHSTEPITVTVGAAGKSWTITSNQPWLPVPSGTQQGDATLTLTLDGAATSQPAGSTATAQLVLQNTQEPIDRHVLDFSAMIVPPNPIVSVTPVTLGGWTGLDGLSGAVTVSLDTGTNAYPWTVTLDAPQSPGWVVSDISSGSISGTQNSTVTMSAGTAIGAMGNYSATANFDVLVHNQTFRTSVPVTMKWHGQRLFADQDGVAFSSFPSRPQPAARTMKIRGSRGMDGVPWTATSDQGWLSVTPSGVTGGNLTLNANPAGLSANSVHLAEVTLASSSANIERNEKIRVGLWVGNTNPANTAASVTDFPYGLVVNPVEPYAYLLSGGNVHVYNIYSGAEIATFNIAIGNFGSLEISSDGRTLFAASLPGQVLALDAVTGQIRATYLVSSQFGAPSDSTMNYTRTNGYPLLFTQFGDISTTIYDLETGAPLPMSRLNGGYFRRFESLRALSPDGRRLFTIDDHSSGSTVSEFTLAFATLGARTLEVNDAASFLTFSSGSTTEMCVAASGTRLYTVAVVLEEISIAEVPPRRLREIEMPTSSSANALSCNWNGRTYVGLTTFQAPQNNVLVLDAAGNDLGTFPNGPADSGVVRHQMGLSGDARRMVSTHVESGNPDPVITLQFFNVPQ